MKNYRYTIALTSQFYYCAIPFRLDTSPKCSLNCLYCFAMARGGRRTSESQIADPNYIERRIERSLLNDYKKLDNVGELLKKKMPLHFGGMSDPFSNEMVSKKSIEILNIFSKYDYPIVISTKNTEELVKDTTLKTLQKIKYLALQVSMTNLQDSDAKLIEPNVPSSTDRIRHLSTLSKENIHTIVRLQPIIPHHIDEIPKSLIPKLGEAGVRHIVTEFLKIPVERISSEVTIINEVLKLDLFKYYINKLSVKTSREWVLPSEYKWELLQPIIESIHSVGMTFGAGDYGLNHLGDTSCCCGISGLKGFENINKANFAFLIASTLKKYLFFTDMESQNLPIKSIKMYMNSHSRIEGKNLLIDFLRHKWNKPKSENAPDSFLGVTWTGDFDEDHNCIYENTFRK